MDDQMGNDIPRKGRWQHRLHTLGAPELRAADGRPFDRAQNGLSQILLVGRSWSGDNCAGDSDCHATASMLGSRHVPVSKPSRAAAGGASARVGR